MLLFQGSTKYHCRWFQGYRELKVIQDSDRKTVGIEKELPIVIPFDDISDLAGEGITNIEDYLGIEKYPDEI